MQPALSDDLGSLQRAVRAQFLASQLGDSLERGVLGEQLPQSALLQITAMTDVGVSAQTLLDTLYARRSTQPMPPYPRNMLCMELSDGFSKTIMAYEDAHIGALVLGETRLGAKIVVRSLRREKNGVVFLRPETTSVLGGAVPELARDGERKLELALCAKLNIAPSDGQTGAEGRGPASASVPASASANVSATADAPTHTGPTRSEPKVRPEPTEPTLSGSNPSKPNLSAPTLPNGTRQVPTAPHPPAHAPLSPPLTNVHVPAHASTTLAMEEDPAVDPPSDAWDLDAEAALLEAEQALAGAPAPTPDTQAPPMQHTPTLSQPKSELLRHLDAAPTPPSQPRVAPPRASGEERARLKILPKQPTPTPRESRPAAPIELSSDSETESAAAAYIVLSD